MNGLQPPLPSKLGTPCRMTCCRMTGLGGEGRGDGGQLSSNVMKMVTVCEQWYCE